MRTTKDRHVVVGADFAGYPLKEAVKKHLEERGWTVTDMTPSKEDAPMYHRVGFLVGSQISEGEFEKGLLSTSPPASARAYTRPSARPWRRRSGRRRRTTPT
jgi:hypothetical protein